MKMLLLTHSNDRAKSKVGIWQAPLTQLYSRVVPHSFKGMVRRFWIIHVFAFFMFVRKI